MNALLKNITAATLLLLLGVMQQASAALFQYQYTDTVLSSGVTGASIGDAVKITVALDNGGSSDVAQVWTASDLQSLTFDFNNGGLLTTFSNPFAGGGFADLSGSNFVTDGAGALTSVMSSWSNEFFVPSTDDFTSTGDIALFSWFLNGTNQVYSQRGNVNLTNIANITNAANWTPVSVVPVPSAVWLFGSGLIGLMGLARRKH